MTCVKREHGGRRNFRSSGGGWDFGKTKERGGQGNVCLKWGGVSVRHSWGNGSVCRMGRTGFEIFLATDGVGCHTIGRDSGLG